MIFSIYFVEADFRITLLTWLFFTFQIINLLEVFIAEWVGTPIQQQEVLQKLLEMLTDAALITNYDAILELAHAGNSGDQSKSLFWNSSILSYKLLQFIIFIFGL